MGGGTVIAPQDAMRASWVVAVVLCSCGGRYPLGFADAGVSSDAAVDVSPVDAEVESCGWFTFTQCGDDEWCDFVDDHCGAVDGMPGVWALGVCRPRPGPCVKNYQPVCGCDGFGYANRCYAEAGGVDTQAGTVCVPVGAQFSCGTTTCSSGLEYCEHVLPDLAGNPPSWECRALPDACSSPSCACLSDEPCGDSCAEAAPGAPTVTCG